jgi:thiol:disulfide interchange protein
MKTLFLFFTILLFSGGIAVATGNDASDRHGELKVFQGTFQEALKESEATGKPVFLELYASWCGRCQRFNDNTLTDDEVIAYLNKHFVFFKQDLEQGEGPDLARRYEINSHPAGVFVKSSGETIHSYTGLLNAKRFLGEAETALNSLR